MNPEQFLRDHSPRPEDLCLSRRQFLQRAGMGFGALGLAGLLSRTPVLGAASPAPTIKPHFAVKATRVIHIFAQGGPSHVDTWDPKPLLNQRDGQDLPDLKGVAMGSSFKFSRHGKSGIEVSEVFSEIAKHVDDLAVIRSMHTDIPAHDVATIFMNTGSLRMAKPSLGAWTLYGLGSENENMPGFISLRPGGSPPGGVLNWGSAFLPGNFQATSINTRAASVEQMIQNIRNPYLGKEEQRRQLDLVQKLNAAHQKNLQDDPQLEARIQSFEMAYRMQMEATDAFDISKEPATLRELYGDSAQGRQMLIARRLIERGVRFVQVWAGGWDHHEDIATRLSASAQEVDRPAAALLADLKQRGLLDDTLVIWGGEFGRTSDSQGAKGRDHNPNGFTIWMAGGGVKRGLHYGATDPFGYKAVEKKVHVNDLHATLLHLMGLNHEDLTYRFNGRDFRLTDVAGSVINEILA
ncbi:MAG: DUF1501 domain-containing protein [Planctomycetaceae bacterium]